MSIKDLARAIAIQEIGELCGEWVFGPYDTPTAAAEAGSCLGSVARVDGLVFISVYGSSPACMHVRWSTSGGGAWEAYTLPRIAEHFERESCQ